MGNHPKFFDPEIHRQSMAIYMTFYHFHWPGMKHYSPCSHHPVDMLPEGQEPFRISHQGVLISLHHILLYSFANSLHQREDQTSRQSRAVPSISHSPLSI